MNCDILIIGAGIIGLAVAREASRQFPDARIVLVEKEEKESLHQSGRNSGVIHSGIYYAPASYKARLCREGRLQLFEFCHEHDIPYEVCGKIVLASKENEQAGLHALYAQAQKNKIPVEWYSPEALHEREPYGEAQKALFVPDAGIIHYPNVCAKLREVCSKENVQFFFNSAILNIEEHKDAYLLHSSNHEWLAKTVISCAGLYSDKIARKAGFDPGVRIIPFRGEYYELREHARKYCRHLIYPVPDARFPFLGVHLTRMIQGGVECGPNAVFAFGREAYTWKDISVSETLESVCFSGFRNLAAKYWQEGLREMKRSLFKKEFLRSLQALVPELQESDLVPGRSGIRAQAVLPDGSLVDDFLIQKKKNCICVLNAPSPAATSSFAIAQEILRLVQQAS